MKRKLRWFKTLFLPQTFYALVAAFAIAAFYIVFCVSALEQNITFSVKKGSSVSAVAYALKKNNIINSIPAFKISVLLNGNNIKSGDYDIPKNASVYKIAKMLATGDIASTTIVIPEGLTVKQIKELLNNNPNLTGSMTCQDDSASPVCNLQDGQIFPDTYTVAKGTLRLAVLELAYKKMQTIQNNWIKAGEKAPKPLKDWNDVVTLASIVQKETPVAKEMPIVASVYLNRLNKNMRLQADPTVVYALTNGLGDMKGEPLLRGHLKIESPYNTYANNGLPPAPIANVGKDAIKAVLNPADTNYLFFVADGTGGHRFAESYEQHMQNHADWREIKKLQNKN